MSSQGKAAAVMALKIKRPALNNTRIAEIVGCSRAYVSQVLSQAAPKTPEAPMERPANLPEPATTTPSAWTTQVGGDHYTKLKIQPMQFSMDNKLDACQHTIIKYVTRFRDKGGLRDLNAAKHVIDMLIEREYGPSAN